MDENLKQKYLSTPVEHIDITSFDARAIIEQMSKMSFTARDVARASDIYNRMLQDPSCSIILTIAGSTMAAGCLKLYADMIKYKMVDAVVATGASIVDMDFFEALGFRHYQGTNSADDNELRELGIDRIYDTYIDEDELQICDRTITGIANGLEPRPYSSREFIAQMGKWLTKNAKKKGSLVQLAYEHEIPVFCPAFTDSSAGFGLVLHQARSRSENMTLDSIRDFKELTDVKIRAGTTGLFMIGGGVPKNFAQDTVVCAELLGSKTDMHKYAVQVTVADVRDGACSSSTLKEACSWGKVETVYEQMVYAEATSVLPLIISDVYHRGIWRDRSERRWSKIFR